MFAPRFYTQTEPNFTGLFRLIDEFDNYASQQQQPQSNGRQHQHQRQHSGGRRAFRQVQTFTPKFDLKENDADFELHGELPGIEKDQVHIEFTDPQTILIRGRVERARTTGTPPAFLLEEDSDKMSGALTGGEQQSETSSAEKRRSSFHATVEDDVEEGNSTAAPTPATTTTEISRPAPTEQPQQQQQQPRLKYWISERSVGEFSRSFQFPTRVEHDGVSASLNNGVLTVVVPKAKKHESRRIAIN